MSAAELLKQLPGAFQPDAASGVDCTVQFNASATAHMVVKDGTCAVHEGAAAAPDLTITMDDDDLVALLKGELNGMTAFMTGKMQLEGDLMLAQRMMSFFDPAKLS
ncbi:MAG: SCP2 sterol-binding domain-containing protein [Gammaproteobacteria bacterium]|nr:SCP2 sterol-binding domain-containing protein [Gammaproteobacteria bacterium]